MRCASGTAPRALVLGAALAGLGCSPRQISDSGFGAYEVSLAAWSDGLAIAWYDTRDGNAEVYVRTLDADVVAFTRAASHQHLVVAGD